MGWAKPLDDLGGRLTIRPNLRDFSGGGGGRDAHIGGGAWFRVPVSLTGVPQQWQRGEEFRGLNLGSGLSAQPSTLGTG